MKKVVHKKSVFLHLVTIVTVMLMSACGGTSAPTDTADGKEPEVTNVLPVANAGLDIAVLEVDTVLLNGSGSTDPAERPLNYAWTQLSGIGVALKGDTEAHAEFRSPRVSQPEILIFELKVISADGEISTDTVKVTVNPRPPLSVQSIQPTSSAQDADRMPAITVTFSESVIPQGIEDYIALSDQFGKQVEIGSVDVNDNTLTITPKEKLYQQSEYTLSISMQLEDIYGKPMQEDFTSLFTTKASSWGVLTAFSEGGGHSKAAINNVGNIITGSWSYNNSSRRYEITKVERNVGEWDAGEVISEANQVYQPNIALDNNGNAIFTWVKTFQDEIIVTEYRDGQWLEPWVLYSESGNVHNSLAIADSGYAAIAWADRTDIYVEEYINGNWTTKTLASAYRSHSPKIRLNSSGDGIVIWKSEANSYDDGVLYASIRKQGKWGEPTIVSGATVDEGGHDLAIDGNGEAIVVWNTYDGDAREVYKNEYRNGSWQGEERLTNVAGHPYLSRVSMNEKGDAIVSWTQWLYPASGLPSQEAYVKTFRDNVWNDAYKLDDGAHPEVGIDERGNAIVFWEKKFDTHRELFYSQYVDGSWGVPTYFSLSDNKLNPMKYSVQMNDRGDVVIVWSQSDSGTWYQYRSVYE
ncbi:Ig-like domain-containing protein [Pseudomonadota bacterium]